MVQSLRLRLTLWYTALFVVLSFILVVTLNVLAVQYYRRTEVGIDALSQSRYEDIFAEPIQDRIRREQIVDVIRMVRQDDLNQIQVSSFVMFSILVGLSLVGGHYIAVDILKPIQDLNRQIKRIQAEDLQKVHYPHNDSDVQELVSSLNEMLLRIGKSFRSQREFIEHASHELKTPLAVLSLQIESLLEEDDLDEYQQSLLRSALASVMTLNTLLESLMLLSLAEDTIERTSLSVESLVESLQKNIIAYDATASDRLSMIWDEAKETLIAASPELLVRAVGNIIENALKYTPSEAPVEVTFVPGKMTLDITIRDHGQGIPSDKVCRIFDRFYRLDDSRSKKTGGRGLGLAITKSIIELHKGTVVARNHPDGGAEFVVKVPV